MKNQWLPLFLIFVVTLLAYVGYSLLTRDPDVGVGERPPQTMAEGLPAPSLTETALTKPGQSSQSTPLSLITGLDDKDDTRQRGRGIVMDDLSRLTVDEQIAIYIPQEDSEYQGYVSDIQTTAAGNQTVIGHLLDQGQEFRFVFTVGAMQTFGTLHTPRGRYQLEVRDGVGRMIAAATINQGLDFSRPDYVIPERETLEKTSE